jgi:hypothetical protein
MKFEPVIYERWEGGAHKVRSLKRGLADLKSGEASFLAIADANPAACWVRVELDDEDQNFVWVTQTDVNSAKNKAYAAGTAVRESVQDLIENYRFELKDYRLSQKRKVEKND